MSRVDVRSLIFLSMLLCSSCNRAMLRTDPCACPAKDAPITASVIDAVKSREFVWGQWPQEQWWQMFNDAKLSQLIEEALCCNPLLKSDLSKVEVAKQLAMVSRSKLFPSVNADPNMLYTHLSKNGLLRSFNPVGDPNIHPTFMILDFTYEFDLWGKNWSGFQAALHEAHAQEALSAQTRLMIAINVASEYFDYQSLVARSGCLKKLLEKTQTLRTLVQAQRVHRIASELDVLEMEEKILEIETMLEENKKEMELTEHQIGVLLGKSPDLDAKITPDWSPFAKTLEIPEDIEGKLLSRRADLCAQLWRIHAAAKRIKVAKAQFFPSLSLDGLGGFEGMDFNNIFTKQSLMGLLFPLLHVPIFTGGRLTANLSARLREFETAVYDYNQAVLTSAQEVSDRMSEMRALHKEVDIQGRRVGTAQEKLQLTELRYIHRVDSRIDVLQQEIEVIYRQLEELEMQKWQYFAALGFIKSIGGGYKKGAMCGEN